MSLNPQKLAGMCAKLKCCLNYEVDEYVEAGRTLPSKEVVLQTVDNDYYYFKADILAGLITYSTDKRIPANLQTITAEKAKEIIEMNRRGEKPATLQDESAADVPQSPVELLQGDLNRFDKNKKKKRSTKPQRNSKGKETQEEKNVSVAENKAPKPQGKPNNRQPRQGKGRERDKKEQ